MRHRSVEQIQESASVRRETSQPMTPVERLDRWAALLELDPSRRLRTLHGTEFARPAERDRLRSESSPISVAFADEILRREGLEGDTYGDARRFFAITDVRLHRIVCSCHLGGTVSSGTSARGIRRAISVMTRPGVLGATLRGIERVRNAL